MRKSRDSTCYSSKTINHYILVRDEDEWSGREDFHPVKLRKQFPKG
jgi:hypothetical protein